MIVVVSVTETHSAMWKILQEKAGSELLPWDWIAMERQQASMAVRDLKAEI